MTTMTEIRKMTSHAGPALVLTVASALLAGCSGFNTTTNSSPISVAVPKLTGSVHGGQQPIGKASILLYAASTSGYGAASSSLLTTTVTTSDGTGVANSNANAGNGYNTYPLGSFTITGDYSCTAGQQIYLVSSGGSADGVSLNPNAALMAALGDCAGLSSSTYINLNEVTTVGSVFALSPFMTSSSAVGSSSTNTAGLARAFASVNKLVNIATGLAGGSALPSGATAPAAEINSLAGVLASCINSDGGSASDTSTNCGKLFSYVTPGGSTAPTDTIKAALMIAQNPTYNVSTIYGSASAQSPFAPTLASAPNDWTMAVTYSTGLNAPKSTTIDANGNVWVANSGNNTVAVLAQTGAPISGSPFSGNGLGGPVAVAMDAGGNAWVANSTGNSLSVFTSTGGVFTSSPFTPSNLSFPNALAFDASGNLWVSSHNNNSVVEVSGSGTYLQQITSGISSPVAIAVDPK